MINTKYIKSCAVAFICSVIFTGSNLCSDIVTAQPAVPVQAAGATMQQSTVKPLSVVNSPSVYLNRKIVMNAKFDKFSTLGLDYKPALRSSEKYISFLIKRDDTQYNIPLSEMKLFMKREVAEKFIDLRTNDEIKISGTVFSDALGDAWVDVDSITVINKAPESDGVKQ